VDVLDLFRMVDQAANRALTGALPRREIQVLLRGNLPRSLPAQWIKGLQKVVCLCTYLAHHEPESVDVTIFICVNACKMWSADLVGSMVAA